MKKVFVHQKDGVLYDLDNQRLQLKGVGLNAWFLPEGYMFKSYGDIDRPRRFEAWTKRLLGKEKSDQFWSDFRKVFITEKDIIIIKSLGFNSVRIPFDYEVLFEPSKTDTTLIPKAEGFSLLDDVIKWCEKHQIYIILDCHAAPGGQTGTNIDNSFNDHPDLFTSLIYQKQTIYLWTYIASRYQHEPWIACYDLLNEPLPLWQNQYNHLLMPLYNAIIKGIRSVDQNHMITIEGVHWATDVSIFDHKPDDQIIIQFHKYWSRFDIEALKTYLDLSKKWKVPLIMGEGGEHDLMWYSGAFKQYDTLGISWNFWSYKKMDTHNSIVSFKEPYNFSRCLIEDPSLDSRDIEHTFDALLQEMHIDQCDINKDVINHLFQKVPFNTYAFAYDFPIEKPHYVESSGKKLNPDFSLHKKQGVDSPYPCVKLKKDKTYHYTFLIDEALSHTQITIKHNNLTDFELYIDEGRIFEISNLDQNITFDTTLCKGHHKLIIKPLVDAILCDNQFIHIKR